MSRATEWITVQVLLQGVIGHELVHQQSLIPVRAIPNKIDEIRMVEEAEHQHFDQELSVALHAVPVELLDCHDLAARKQNQCSADKKKKKQAFCFILYFTWPLSRVPLYTLPKPPSPSRQSGVKWLVAMASSRNVKLCAWMLPPALAVAVAVAGAVTGLGDSFGLTGGSAQIRMDVIW